MVWIAAQLAAWFALAGPADAVSLATLVLTAVAVVLAARLLGLAPGGSLPAPAVPARARLQRTSTVRLADPDAPGRPRPRAPGH